jgi:hypothetical protein
MILRPCPAGALKVVTSSPCRLTRRYWVSLAFLGRITPEVKEELVAGDVVTCAPGCLPGRSPAVKDPGRIVRYNARSRPNERNVLSELIILKIFILERRYESLR